MIKLWMIALLMLQTTATAAGDGADEVPEELCLDPFTSCIPLPCAGIACVDPCDGASATACECLDDFSSCNPCANGGCDPCETTAMVRNVCVCLDDPNCPGNPCDDPRVPCDCPVAFVCENPCSEPWLSELCECGGDPGCYGVCEVNGVSRACDCVVDGSCPAPCEDGCSTGDLLDQVDELVEEQVDPVVEYVLDTVRYYDTDGDEVPDAVEPFLCGSVFMRNLIASQDGALGHCDSPSDYRRTGIPYYVGHVNYLIDYGTTLADQAVRFALRQVAPAVDLVWAARDAALQAFWENWEMIDHDHDLVPDLAEPALCAIENQNFPLDGRCTGNNYHPYP